MEVVGQNGKKKRSESGGPTTNCQYQSDFYGNFQPDNFTYDVAVSFIVDSMPFPSQPWFVTRYDFGISDVELQVVKVSLTG